MTNPKITIPGSVSDTVKSSYEYVPFPKAVYGEDLDDCVIINNEDERPDGYRDYDEMVEVLAEKEAAGKAERMVPKSEAELAADAAKKEAEAAAKEHRDSIKAYLDEHNVDYAKNLSTPKLEELKVALDEHLGQQDTPDDAQ